MPVRMVVGLCLALAAAMSSASALADADPPTFNFQIERDLLLFYKPKPRNKAYAMGLNNLGGVYWNAASLAEARKGALKSCRDYVTERLGKVKDTQCRIVMENDSHGWPANRPPPLTSNHLPQPDLPLMKAKTLGDFVAPRAILLAVHGCNGPSPPDDPWAKSWFQFFTDRGFAVIEPDSFADPHPQTCTDQGSANFFDHNYRLRVAQTLRTLATIRKTFPGKPIVLWGHSEGGNIVQLVNYKVNAIIITGTSCWEPQPAPETPVLHIFGGEDNYSRVEGLSKPLEEKDIRRDCRNFGKTGKKRYVIVPHGDHFVNVFVPVVSDALTELIGQLGRRSKSSSK